jgi:hypothetical protein
VAGLAPSWHAFLALRIALLIGNQAYNRKVGPLKNPHADIELAGASLKLLSSLDAVVFIRLQTQ